MRKTGRLSKRPVFRNRRFVLFFCSSGSMCSLVYDDSLAVPCVFDSRNVQVRSLERPAPGGAGVGGTKRERGRGDGEDVNGGGDPLREAFNRLGSIIDFQAHQQVTDKPRRSEHSATTARRLSVRECIGMF